MKIEYEMKKKDNKRKAEEGFIFKFDYVWSEGCDSYSVERISNYVFTNDIDIAYFLYLIGQHEGRNFRLDILKDINSKNEGLLNYYISVFRKIGIPEEWMEEELELNDFHYFEDALESTFERDAVQNLNFELGNAYDRTIFRMSDERISEWSCEVLFRDKYGEEHEIELIVK